MIEVIHENINDSLHYLWFNGLPVVELTDTCNELRTFTKQVIMENALGIDNVLKDGNKDPVLSHCLGAEVYYFWGEEKKSIFDIVGNTHAVTLSDEVDCIAFRLDGVVYVFVHFDDLDNVDSACEACEAVQNNWYFSEQPSAITEEFEQFFIEKTIPFIIHQMYYHYDFMLQLEKE